MAKGLHQYIASEDALVIPSKYACIAPAAKNKLTTSQKAESDVLREKDRVKLLTFNDSEDRQAKGILLQTLSDEHFAYVTADVTIAIITTKQLFDRLKQYADESENPKVQIRQEQFRLMRQGATEPIMDYFARLDAVQTSLRDSRNAYTQR